MIILKSNVADNVAEEKPASTEQANPEDKKAKIAAAIARAKAKKNNKSAVTSDDVTATEKNTEDTSAKKAASTDDKKAKIAAAIAKAKAKKLGKSTNDTELKKQAIDAPAEKIASADDKKAKVAAAIAKAKSKALAKANGEPIAKDTPEVKEVTVTSENSLNEKESSPLPSNTIVQDETTESDNQDEVLPVAVTDKKAKIAAAIAKAKAKKKLKEASIVEENDQDGV